MARICFFRYGDELIIDSLAIGFERIGYETKTIVIDPRNISIERTRGEIEAFQPDVCFTHNFYALDCFNPERDLEKFLVDKNIPVAIWFFDPAVSSGSPLTTARYLFETLPENILSIACDSGDHDFLKSRNLKSDFLPLGVADELIDMARKTVDSKRFHYDVAFSGRAMGGPSTQLQNVDEIFYFYANWMLHETVAGYRVPDQSPEANEKMVITLAECFRKGFGEFFSGFYVTVPEYQAAKNRLIENIREMLGDFMVQQYLPVAGRVDFVYSWYQLNLYLEALEEFNLGAFGDAHWQNLIPKYPHSTPKLSLEEMVELYQTAKINFCLTKWHFHNMAHERVMITSAVGGFPITDYRADLEKLYTKDELVMFRGIDEAKDLIRFYLKHDSERLRIAEKARRRVEKEHTYSIRARQLADILHRHFHLPKAK
jgi:hypothetical protein